MKRTNKFEYNAQFESYLFLISYTMPIATILFDLDNTLYSPSSGLMQRVDEQITSYVQRVLGLDQAQALRVRRRYVADYGTTLRGLQYNHGVDAEDYLAYVHNVVIESYLSVDAELDRLLDQVVARKAIFTNAPYEHAQRVLQVLGIERHFTQVFDIRFCDFRPKPDPLSYQRTLAVLGEEGSLTVLIEDTAQNLAPARALGMITMLIATQTNAQVSALADYVVPDIHAALRIVQALEHTSG